MPLTIADDQLARIDLTPERLKLEIAVMLREKDKMSYRAAAGLAGMTPAAFCDLLRERDVPWIHVGGTTEEEALEYIRQEFGGSARLAEMAIKAPAASMDGGETGDLQQRAAASGGAAA